MLPLHDRLREKILVLADLIKSGMDLEENVISVYNQKRKLPAASGIFIDVAFLGSKPFSVSSAQVYDPDEDDMLEEQTITERQLYQIDILSQDATARQRKHEIVFALTGTEAQQAQEFYGFHIAKLPLAFNDLSQTEGPSRLNRYSVTVAIIASISKRKVVQAFNSFQNPPKTLLTNQ